MPPVRRQIFRPQAVERFLQRRREPVFADLFRPRTRVFLWLVAILSLACGVLAWTIQIPVYETGQALLVSTPPLGSIETPVFIAFFPADQPSRLTAGQTLFVDLGHRREWLRIPISGLEPGTLSPREVRQRFGSYAGLCDIDAPVTVGRASWESPTPDVEHLDGSVYPARVLVDSRPVLSLLQVLALHPGAPEGGT